MCLNSLHRHKSMQVLKIKNVIIAAALTLSITGCSSSKKNALTYFQNIDSISNASITTGDYKVKIEPADELFISVNSLVPAASAPYNLPLANPATSGTIPMNEQPRQSTYKVDTAGNIIMPVLGKVHVEGLTTTQLADKLTKMVENEVKDPMVTVELLNFRINVLGEVNAPGGKRINRERYSILDAIADAGDLNAYGQRENVILIREENGKRTYHKFNLNDASTLSSPYFYLKQNDVVYVEPNKIKQENAKYNTNNAFKISVISTIVSACSVVASLLIALSKR